ncbi:MAG: XdhC/CoxI family protein [Bacteroidota bacterium]
MKEVLEIVHAYDTARKSRVRAALATIVKVHGSTYRRPGARMFMTERGEMVGSLSGGCLDADVLEKAKKVMQTGEPVTAVYDMTSDNEVWGLSQGCNGVVHLLLEPIPPETGSRHLDFLRTCIDGKKQGAIGLVFRTDGEFKAKVGNRVSVEEGGVVFEDTANPVLTSTLLDACHQCLRNGASATQRFDFLDGVVEAYVDVVGPPLPLVLFGAGPDAIPLVRMAKELGWEVTVVDHRPAFAMKERFPSADSVILSRPEELGEKVSLSAHSAVVIMTHNFLLDVDLLKFLLPSPLQYLGLLGPTKRTELILQRLKKSGLEVTQDQHSRLYNPIGVDIGAESPEEIALSILSEIRAVVAGRSAGFLRDYRGPIHGTR